MWRRFLVVLIVQCAAQTAAIGQARTVEDDQQLINWYYAATFGTGIYSAGDRTVGVLQAPISYTMREASEDQWGLRLTLPVSVGFYDFDFDDLIGEGIPGRINTFSIMPGIEFRREVLPGWDLRPYVSAGGGWELGGDESALIYDTGIRSRYRFREGERTSMSLLNRLSMAGFYPSGGSHEPLGLFAIGIDFEISTGGRIFDRAIGVSIIPAYYYYFSRLDFAEITDPDNKVREEVELLVSLIAKDPFNILGIDVDRLGIAVRGNKDVSGFRIFTSLPF